MRATRLLPAARARCVAAALRASGVSALAFFAALLLAVFLPVVFLLAPVEPLNLPSRLRLTRCVIGAAPAGTVAVAGRAGAAVALAGRGLPVIERAVRSVAARWISSWRARRRCRIAASRARAL